MTTRSRRDRPTGRYVHCFCWQGYDADGQEWTRCCTCYLWQVGRKRTMHGPERTWSSPDPVHRTAEHIIFGAQA